MAGFGPLPSLCSICLSPAHSKPSCRNSVRCRCCLKFGHSHYSYITLPRSPPFPLSGRGPWNSRNHHSPGSLSGGAQGTVRPKFYPSFTDYFKEQSGLATVPSPITVPWHKPWRLQAPEFKDEDDSAELQSPPPQSASSSTPVFTSFSRYASHFLGTSHSSSISHVSWYLKTPIAATVSPAMAFRFVDPTPFMPQWGHRVMIPGRPAMHRVVTGRIQRRHNDVAIAYFHPLPPNQLQFQEIRETLAQFLNVQMNMPYFSIHRSPFVQAVVTFTHVSHRDFMIEQGPHQVGNMHISFVPHDWAWNNRTAVFTHKA